MPTRSAPGDENGVVDEDIGDDERGPSPPEFGVNDMAGQSVVDWSPHVHHCGSHVFWSLTAVRLGVGLSSVGVGCF